MPNTSEGEGIKTKRVASLDLTRDTAEVHFDAAEAEKLEGTNWTALEMLLTRAAVSSGL